MQQAFPGQAIRIDVGASWDHRELSRRLGAAFHTRPTLTRRVLVIVAGAEHITDALACAVLAEFAWKAGSGQHLVVTGPAMPALSWSRLQVAGRLSRIEQAQLRDWLVRRREADASSMAAADDASHLLARLNAELTADQRLLLDDLAVLGEADVPLLYDVSGIGAVDLLPRLRDRPLPLIDVELRAQPTMVVREPLRALLIDHAQRVRPDRTLAKAATGVRALRRRQLDAQAFDLLLHWGNPDAVAQFVFTRGAQLALNGRPEHAVRWLATFKPEELLQRPTLAIAQAIAQASAGDFTTLDRWITPSSETDSLPLFQLPSDDPVVIAASDDYHDRERNTTDLASLPWRVLGAATSGFVATIEGRLAEAESILVDLTAHCRGYALLDLWRCVTLSFIYARTQRMQLGASVLDYAARRAEREALVDHPWLMTLDAARARYASLRHDESSAATLLVSGLSKVQHTRNGQAGARLFTYLELARTAQWLGQTMLAQELLAVCDSLAGQVPSARLLLDELAQLRALVPDPNDNERPSLSTAELRVLRYLAGPQTVPEIAAHLFVSPATVRAQIRSLHRKLRTHDRLNTVAVARQWGLL